MMMSPSRLARPEAAVAFCVTMVSRSVDALRLTALHRLMGQTQQLDPFRFLSYADLAGAEIGPVR